MSDDVPRFRALVALGANSGGPGEPERVVRAAMESISELLDAEVEASALYASPAFPVGSGPDFVNAACLCRTTLPPEAVLAALHEAEAEAGRVRDVRWGPRTLDLDLIAWEDRVLPDPEGQRRWRELGLDRQMREAPGELILPHPRMQDRAFVLVPLAEVAPEWRHPLLGRTVREMRDALPEEALREVTPL
ncbi:2-amino-4-hydroxy-6-hydroxymethyldihydropteridine diphosphokinase [Histidinibacterium aquaticum]|uniref:2-amino-4-hydroxy-6-hydroxymethyldihydropteridine pyrophosphokinase n=1 Tax=Histidinibacterium aquaticum TaxID=2613962 RepID=A0A5J5GFS3_9RHOB|nr:2-amino-4-hydroxy-6-hydroxymethyldihydropteridine diphosphokinase [Histidinibacterium aquaticum]KAA9007069.1 2-amino-4-hydroxy-6-hydroxymethyldihydropteridine diphosphokinase [Histidinibacterium aquaticum]